MDLNHWPLSYQDSALPPELRKHVCTGGQGGTRTPNSHLVKVSFWPIELLARVLVVEVRLELTASTVSGQRSSQLSYSTSFVLKMPRRATDYTTRPCAHRRSWI